MIFVRQPYDKLVLDQIMFHGDQQVVFMPYLRYNVKTQALFKLQDIVAF